MEDIYKERRKKIIQLREQGMGYYRIAESLNISVNTVKSYCRRMGLGGVLAASNEPGTRACRYCGKEVYQQTGRKAKLYCNDQCRMNYWNRINEKQDHRAVYEFVCPQCKKSFTAYGNKNRKYCSQLCMFTARFGYRDYWTGKAKIYHDSHKTDQENATEAKEEKSGCVLPSIEGHS